MIPNHVKIQERKLIYEETEVLKKYLDVLNVYFPKILTIEETNRIK